MMNEKERIARKLAQITGRPITEFFDGTITEETIKTTNSGESQSSDTVNVHIEKAGDNTEESIGESTPKAKETRTVEVTEELSGYQKMFNGSD